MSVPVRRERVRREEKYREDKKIEMERGNRVEGSEQAKRDGKRIENDVKDDGKE